MIVNDCFRQVSPRVDLFELPSGVPYSDQPAIYSAWPPKVSGNIDVCRTVCVSVRRLGALIAPNPKESRTTLNHNDAVSAVTFSGPPVGAQRTVLNNGDSSEAFPQIRRGHDGLGRRCIFFHHPYGPVKTARSSAPLMAGAGVTSEVTGIFERSCQNCHSERT